MTELKEKIILKTKTLNYKLYIKYICLFILGGVSTLARYSDYPLSILPLLVMQCFNKNEYMLVYSLASFISFGILTANEIYYIPYFITTSFYCLAKIISKKKSVSALSSSVVFLFLKILVSFMNTSFSMKALFVVETMLFILLPLNIKSGYKNIKNSKQMFDFEDCLNTLSFMLAISFMLSGIFKSSIYLDVAIGFGFSVYFIRHLKFDLSFLSFICSMILLSAKNDFYLMFLSFLAVYIVTAIFSKKQWYIIYNNGILSSVLISLMTIKYHGSLSLVLTVTTALIIDFLLYKYLPFNNGIPQDFLIHSQKDYHRLMSNLNKLNNSLSFLGNTAVDISKINYKSLNGKDITDLVCEDVCKKCNNSNFCWQQKYNDTQTEFFKYSKNIRNNQPIEFADWFINRCSKTEKIQQSFEENSKVLLTKKYINKSQESNQTLLQSAFLAISHTIADIAYQSKKANTYNTLYTLEMDKFITFLNIKSTYCLASQYPDKFVLSSLDELNERILYKIKAKLEMLYNKKFDNPQLDYQYNEKVYSFYSKPMFRYEVYSDSKGLDLVCGDSCEYFEVEEHLFIVLSDGMGTGNFAAGESRTAISMAKSLLNAKVDISNVIEIVNLALNLKSNGETGASLDILCVDKYTGETTLTKAGAGETVVLHENGVQRLYKDSLPLGISKDIKTTTHEFILNDNDVVVLISDGVKLDNSIKSMYTHSCENIVNSVLSGKTYDDKTALAVRLCRN